MVTDKTLAKVTTLLMYARTTENTYNVVTLEAIKRDIEEQILKNKEND